MVPYKTSLKIWLRQQRRFRVPMWDLCRTQGREVEIWKRSVPILSEMRWHPPSLVTGPGNPTGTLSESRELCWDGTQMEKGHFCRDFIIWCRCLAPVCRSCQQNRCEKTRRRNFVYLCFLRRCKCAYLSRIFAAIHHRISPCGGTRGRQFPSLPETVGNASATVSVTFTASHPFVLQRPSNRAYLIIWWLCHFMSPAKLGSRADG